MYNDAGTVWRYRYTGHLVPLHFILVHYNNKTVSCLKIAVILVKNLFLIFPFQLTILMNFSVVY